MIDPVDAAPKSGVEETRQRILAAARKSYAEKGSRGMTTREVAELAGVNEATLFRHFGTKGQLISAMLDHFSGAAMIPATIDSARLQVSLEMQLERLGLGAIEALRSKEDLIKVGMAEELTNPEGTTCMWRAPTEARQALARFMQEKIEGGELRGDPDELARMFMSQFFAYVMASRLWSREDYPPERAVRLFVDFFINGARAR